MFKSLTPVLSCGQTLVTSLVTVVLVAGLSTGSAEAMSMTEIDKTLVKGSSEVFGFLKAEFPSDYDVLLTAIEEVEAVGGDVRSTTSNHIAQWRVAQADVIATADDSQHIEMLSHYTDTLAQLRAVGGSATCGDFILYGSANLSAEDLNGPYEEPITYYLISMMHAAAAARDMPEPRKVASDADWDRVFDIMEERGGTLADLDALVAMDPLDPTFCDATIRLLDAMLVDGDKAVSRVRAEYIGDLVRFS